MFAEPLIRTQVILVKIHRSIENVIIRRALVSSLHLMFAKVHFWLLYGDYLVQVTLYIQAIYVMKLWYYFTW